MVEVVDDVGPGLDHGLQIGGGLGERPHLHLLVGLGDGRRVFELDAAAPERLRRRAEFAGAFQDHERPLHQGAGIVRLQPPEDRADDPDELLLALDHLGGGHLRALPGQVEDVAEEGAPDLFANVVLHVAAQGKIARCHQRLDGNAPARLGQHLRVVVGNTAGPGADRGFEAVRRGQDRRVHRLVPGLQERLPHLVQGLGVGKRQHGGPPPIDFVGGSLPPGHHVGKFVKSALADLVGAVEIDIDGREGHVAGVVQPPVPLGAGHADPEEGELPVRVVVFFERVPRLLAQVPDAVAGGGLGGGELHGEEDRIHVAAFVDADERVLQVMGAELQSPLPHLFAHVKDAGAEHHQVEIDLGRVLDEPGAGVVERGGEPVLGPLQPVAHRAVPCEGRVGRLHREPAPVLGLQQPVDGGGQIAGRHHGRAVELLLGPLPARHPFAGKIGAARQEILGELLPMAEPRGAARFQAFVALDQGLEVFIVGHTGASGAEGRAADVGGRDVADPRREDGGRAAPPPEGGEPHLLLPPLDLRVVRRRDRRRRRRQLRLGR